MLELHRVAPPRDEFVQAEGSNVFTCNERDAVNS
jgi:hypothetical protein